MTGWNMPPGVNESDIPGNRPEDAIADKLYALFGKAWMYFTEDDIIDIWRSAVREAEAEADAVRAYEQDREGL
jgi:hypothetical protein